MSQAFTYKISSEGICDLIFDLPGEKVNKFSIPVLEELERIIDSLSTNNTIQMLKLMSGKENVFIAGADLHSFEPAFEDPRIAEKIILTGQRVFRKIEQLPFPTIAVINGACLGGGLECALSCTYRLVSDNPKTLLGLPETSLGIFPGWGGTQRLPRLIGLSEALNMILSGKSVPALKAWKLHLADAIASNAFFSEKVNQFVALVLTKEGRKEILARRGKKNWTRSLLEDNPIGRSILFYQAKKSVLEKTKGKYPAPLIALEVIKNTHGLPLQEGLKAEAAAFANNIPDGFHLAKDLIGLFFTQEALKKETGAPPETPTMPVQSAAVLGAGTMGAGIAWLLADHGIFTRLKDISWELVGHGLAAAYAQFAKGVKVKKITLSDASRRFQLLSGTIDYSGFEHADMVIEAATEDLSLKKRIFAEVESKVRPDAIIATNTSSLRIDSMSKEMQHPERFVGMHFFNPVAKMPLIEVVAGPETNPQTVATTVEFCKKLGKTPIVVQDCAGFLVNRIFLIGANEVVFMLEEGYSPEQIDRAVLGFGMPMGSFELMDEVGVDVTYKVACILEQAYGERMKPGELLHQMIDKGWMGKKKGEGFYLYQGSKSRWNPGVSTLIDRMGRKKHALPDEEILPRFLYTMINEAARCLDEKVVERADFLDMALILGTGFPPFQGGLLRYADKTGLPLILRTLKHLEETQGPRFKASPLLLKMSSAGQKFYKES